MAHPLPPPGPDHYTARRARWLAAPDTPPRTPHAPHVNQRLARLLDNPDLHSDQAWSRGIDQIWSGLITGNKLKHRLPMNLVIKIIHAAWRRDPGTWPEGAVVPDSDEACPTLSLSGSVPDTQHTEPP